MNLKIAISNDSQILDVKSFPRLDTTFPIESMFEELFLWIDVVENTFSIALMTCCKHNQFVVITK
jgi:hypothetical protein